MNINYETISNLVLDEMLLSGLNFAEAMHVVNILACNKELNYKQRKHVQQLVCKKLQNVKQTGAVV